MKQIAARGVRAALLVLLLSELLWTLPWQPSAAGSCACYKNRCGKHPTDQMRTKRARVPLAELHSCMHKSPQQKAPSAACMRLHVKPLSQLLLKHYDTSDFHTVSRSCRAVRVHRALEALSRAVQPEQQRSCQGAGHSQHAGSGSLLWRLACVLADSSRHACHDQVSLVGVLLEHHLPGCKTPVEALQPCCLIIGLYIQQKTCINMLEHSLCLN